MRPPSTTPPWAYPQVKAARHVDRPGSVRTLAEALARTKRIGRD